MVGYLVVPVHVFGHARHIAECASGDGAFLQQVPNAGEHRHVGHPYTGAGAAAADHPSQVAHEAKSGDVGAGVHSHPHHGFRRASVQFGHGVHGFFQDGVGGYSLLNPSSDDSRADRLGKDQDIPGLGVGVGDLFPRFNQADYRKSVFGFGVVHRMSANDQTVGLHGLVVAAFQNVAQHIHCQLGGESDHVQGHQGLPAHGVNIA